VQQIASHINTLSISPSPIKGSANTETDVVWLQTKAVDTDF